LDSKKGVSTHSLGSDPCLPVSSNNTTTSLRTSPLPLFPSPTSKGTFGTSSSKRNSRAQRTRTRSTTFQFCTEVISMPKPTAAAFLLTKPPSGTSTTFLSLMVPSFASSLNQFQESQSPCCTSACSSVVSAGTSRTTFSPASTTSTLVPPRPGMESRVLIPMTLRPS